MNKQQKGGYKMRKVLEVGRTGALVIVADSETKFEVVSCWNFVSINECWSQGHYFTRWYDDITEESKIECIAEARKHFEKNYK